MAAVTPVELHYIFDPLCGWCYGAAPLVRAARGLPGLQLRLHGGGMMVGAGRQRVTAQLRDYVAVHDQRIAQLTGQPFGAAYTDGLLRDDAAVLDSEPPTTAVLAAEDCGGRGADLLHRLQQAHYVEGRRIADPSVLQALAAELGLDAQAFAAAYERLAGDATHAHIADSRRWLARAGGHGFPTFALARADGTLHLQDIGPWLGRPDGWREHLRAQSA